jgi:hypothetical protein
VRRLLVAGLATIAGLAASPRADAHAISSGAITIGQGAAGINLGMNRAQVIAAGGNPLTEDANGYMGYERDSSGKIFGVYRRTSAPSARVHLLIIASVHPGTDYTLSDGNAIFAAGGLRRLAASYGQRLVFHNSIATGPFYRIVTHRHGKKVLNDFNVARHSLSSPVYQVAILYANG